MAKRFIRVFAENGDRSAVSDDTQSSGELSYQQGYGPQYALNPATDPSSRRINRERYNQVLNDITDNLREWQEQLAPDFITPTANGGTAFSYGLGMVVYDPNNSEYRRSTSANNTANVTDDNNWEDYDFSGSEPGFTTSQTWQDVSASRNLGITYTNSTGNIIGINVIVNNNSINNVGVEITLGNGEALRGSATGSSSTTPSTIAWIDPGETYTVTNNGASSIERWLEFR